MNFLSPVEMPLLHLYTRARTRKGAYSMAKDASELAVDKRGFEVTVHPSGTSEALGIEANDETTLLAFALRQ